MIAPNPLRRQLRASIDLIETGSSLADSGTDIRSMGLTMMSLNELPPPILIADLFEAAKKLRELAEELAKARKAAR
jgi:hypothetical protein